MSRDVKFFEDIFPYVDIGTQSTDQTPNITDLPNYFETIKDESTQLSIEQPTSEPPILDNTNKILNQILVQVDRIF